ncbi:MAG TPA: sigma-70 family RNA polymerase sigma factor [Candidatus Gemmiger stercorigallinarum]|nr:sigma-70 family RNA polymerase sigma factor [Candidatus Gemmiger stercorigallinarum]
MQEDLVVQYEKLYRYCYFRVRDADLAEDLTQEAFLRYYRQDESKRQAGGTAYLYGIARNLCTDAFRRRPALPLDDQLPAPDSLADTDRTLALRQAIAGLPADQQEILLLRYANDLPVGRVAAIVGLSRFAVGRKLRVALKRLRETLREEDFA